MICNFGPGCAIEMLGEKMIAEIIKMEECRKMIEKRKKYKQIDMEQALKMYTEGEDIKVLMPELSWCDYHAMNLADLLNGVLYFAEESGQTEIPLPACEPESQTTGPAEAPIVEADSMEAPEKSKSVDDGKIMALRRAGWTVEKIAEEMRVSEQTIYSHLRKMREKGLLTNERK